MGSILILLLVFGMIQFFSKKFHYKAVAMFSIYVGILLVATIVFYFIPSSSSQIDSAVMPNEEEYDREYQVFYDALYAGNVDDIDPAYLEEHQAYTFDGEQLLIEMDAGQTIVIERTTNNDDKIEVFLYKTKTYIENRDVTDRVSHMTFDLAGETLYVKKPEEVSIKLTILQDEFPITQFNGEDQVNDHYSSSYIGDVALYLRIPKDIQLVTDSEDYITYVE